MEDIISKNQAVTVISDKIFTCKKGICNIPLNLLFIETFPPEIMQNIYFVIILLKMDRRQK